MCLVSNFLGHSRNSLFSLCPVSCFRSRYHLYFFLRPFNNFNVRKLDICIDYYPPPLLDYDNYSTSSAWASIMFIFSVNCGWSSPIDFAILRMSKFSLIPSLFSRRMWEIACTSAGFWEVWIWSILRFIDDVFCIFGRGCGEGSVEGLFRPFWRLSGNKSAARHPAWIWSFFLDAH